MGPTASTKRHVFRQRSPLWLAAGCAAAGLFLLFTVARSWAEDPQPLFAAWLLLVMAAVWSIFVRPAVQLDAEGVTLRNILRDVHIPWVQVSDVACRWNLKVFAGDRGYTAWSISSQVERPKGAPGGMFAIPLYGRLDRYSRAAGRPSEPAPRVTASMVARLIEQAGQEYDEAVAAGELPAAPDAQVRIRFVPQVMAILLVPTIAVVVLSLT